MSLRWMYGLGIRDLGGGVVVLSAFMLHPENREGSVA